MTHPYPGAYDVNAVEQKFGIRCALGPPVPRIVQVARLQGPWTRLPDCRSGHDPGVNSNRDGSSTPDTPDPEQHIAEALTRTNHTAAAAESLTGGNVSAGLSSIEGASNWFLGGVVAYAETVKFDLLGVRHGPVITADCAEQMAVGVARLLGADFAVSTTGVGGPGPQEGLPQGTVFIAVATPDGGRARQYSFDGEPSQVVEDSTRRALRDLAAGVDAFLDEDQA